ncbi:hypothetical protein LINPERHAP1_LOCUS26371, partial [Linum perenne]
FIQHYSGGDASEGIYVKDRITFQTSIDGRTNITLRNFLFGCSNYLTNTGTDLEKHFNGIIGLGPSNPGRYLGGAPLVWELGYEFSYCVGRLSDRSYPYNSISFGRNAKMIGMETPIYTNGAHYYVKLLHISIGGKVTFIYVCYIFVELLHPNNWLLPAGLALFLNIELALELFGIETHLQF